MKKYLNKKITIWLRGVKVIAIYHADEDYYALELSGVLYSFKTFKEVQAKVIEYVDRLIYKDTLILREVLTEPDYRRRDFTMLDYFTALINHEKAKAERSPESYMWEKVIRAFEAKKSRKRLHDIKEQMDLIFEEVHIIPKRIKKEEVIQKGDNIPKLKIEQPKRYDGIVITKDLDEIINAFKYKYKLIPPVRIEEDSIIIDLGSNLLRVIPRNQLINYVIPTHLTTINLIFILGENGDVKLQYKKSGEWIIK